MDYANEGDNDLNIVINLENYLKMLMKMIQELIIIIGKNLQFPILK